MPVSVEIPEIGEVEFPDSMTEADIAAASSNLYGQRKGVPPAAQPLAIPPPPPYTPEGRRLAAALEEAPESGLRTLGRGMSALGRYGGRVAMGAAQDIGALIQRGPAGIGEPQTLAALAGGIPSGAPEALSAEGTTAAGEPPKPLGERIAVGAVRGVGEMVPALAGAAVTGGATLPAWFAGQMGLSAYGETGDPGLATRQAAVGALMGQFSRYGSAIGEAAGLRAAAKLPAALENATIEAGKFAGQQAALNYLMTAGNLPELMQEPDKAIDRLAEQVGINLAFAAPHLPEQARRAFSRDWAEQMVRSPEYKRTIDEAVRLAGVPTAERLAPQTAAAAKEPIAPPEATKAPRTFPGVSEPLPTPETAPTAPRQAPAGIVAKPVSAVESVRATENGGRIAIVLPNGKAVVGGQAHADTWNKAVEAGVATDAELASGFAGFVKPDGTAWGVNGKPLPNVTEVHIVSSQIPRETRPELRPAAPIPEQPVKAAEAVPPEFRPLPQPQSPSAPFSPKQAKAQKAYLLEEIDKAHEAAPEGIVEAPSRPPSYEIEEAKAKRIAENEGVFQRNVEKFGTITIRVPGDGVFSIINERGAIERFKEMAKSFPTTSPKPSVPKGTSVKPTQAAPISSSVERSDVLKAADLFSGTDQSRMGLYKVMWSDGERTVATDGRRMIIVDEGVGGTPKQPKVLDASGKEVAQTVDKFPENWNQVVPTTTPKHEITVDTEQLHNIVRQAELMTTAGANSVRVSVNPDNSIGISSGTQGEGFAHNVHQNPKQVVFLQPEYLRDALNAARRLGDNKVKLAIIDELSPVQLIGSNHRSIIMPMRGVGEAPIETRQAVPKVPTPSAPTPAPIAPTEAPAISFPGIGSLREKQATAMELGKIRKAEPELWKAITAYFGETQPGKVTKAAQAAFKRQREQESRAASAGPGAASPVEFEQRARTAGDAAAAGQKPPGDNPPVATDASASPSIEVTRANRDYNILNRVNSGQFAFWFGKLGEAAKQAWERMALGEFRMRESIGRDTKRYVDQLLDRLPRQFRKKGGEAFFDIVNGKKLEDIEAAWSGRDGGSEVIAAARELKTRLEEIRTTIRDTKREAYTAYLNSLDKPILDDLFRKNIDDTVDISRYPKESLSDALAKDAYRDDWGIADGSYLPHLFFGNWKVTVTDAAGESRFVTRSKTPEEAKAEIFKFVQRNPELKDANFKVEQDTVVPADMIRLGDRRFWQLVGKMKEATGLTQGEVREAQQGIIGKKSSKQKWFGSLQKREGYEGYSRDYRQVMTAYLNGFHRWRELSQMQRDVQPLIEAVRREGRQNAATRLDELMDNLWGKPARTTLEFDALVRQIPGLRAFIKPLALERWSRNARSIVAMATLRTLRFALVNRLQPLQGLYPLVGERILAQAKIAQHTKEGRALLDEAGVRLDPGQYRAERAITGKLTEFQERLFGETSNQELAFLAMYQHGIEHGMTRADAINYAKLRGQLFTQFTPLIADTPQMMQGPFAGLLFQFKRFPVKQAELLTRLVQEKRIGGIARWLGVMALAGGASYFLRQFYADAEKKKRLRDKLAEQHGEKMADSIMYGLPGLIGADLSGSLVLGDEPFGENVYEKAGRAVAGPAASIAIDTGRTLGTERREPTTTRQDAVSILKRFPTTRPLAELLTLENSDLDVRTPDGEVRYRKTLKDALFGLGSFRSANESNIKLAIDAMIELKKEIAELKNRYFVESEQGDSSKAEAAIDRFNERWPELDISGAELREYSKLRRKGLDKTDVERISGKQLRSLQP